MEFDIFKIKSAVWEGQYVFQLVIKNNDEVVGKYEFQSLEGARDSIKKQFGDVEVLEWI